MTSNVKSWVNRLVRVSSLCCPLGGTWSIGRAGARNRRRVLTLLSVGGLPPSWRPSGACLSRGTRVSCRLCTPSRAPPHRGCGSAERRAQPGTHGDRPFQGLGLGGQGSLLGHGPHTRLQVPGDGDAPRVGMWPAGAALAVALTQASLGLSAALLARLGQLLSASWARPADCGGGARGPGPCPQGLAVARCGEAALAAPLARRVC